MRNILHGIYNQGPAKQHRDWEWITNYIEIFRIESYHNNIWPNGYGTFEGGHQALYSSQ